MSARTSFWIPELLTTIGLVTWALPWTFGTGAIFSASTLLAGAAAGGILGYRMRGRRQRGHEILQIRQALADRERSFRSLADNASDNIARYDRQGRLLYANRQLETTMGMHAAALIGRTIGEIHPDGRFAEFETVVLQAMAAAQPAEYLQALSDRDGEAQLHHIRITPELDEQGQVIGASAIGRDVTEHKRVEAELEASRNFLHRIVDAIPDPVFVKDSRHRWLMLNDACCQLLGHSRDALLGKTAHDLFPAEEADLLREHDEAVVASGIPNVRDAVVTLPDGELRYLQIKKTPLVAEQRQTYLIGVVRDLTEHRRTAEALAAREQELRTVVENTPDVIVRYDRSCRRIYTNKRLTAQMAAPLDLLLRDGPAAAPGGGHGPDLPHKLRQVIDSGEPDDVELSWRHADGSEACAHVRLVPELDGDGRVASVLAVARDISEIDAYRKQIHALAYYDGLTALPNRALLGERIRHAQAEASAHGLQFGLMLLDLDRFKEINDTLGHGTGDRVLCAAAERLRNCMRSRDTVARLGGDEFAVLLPRLPSRGALATAAREVSSAFEQPLLVDGRELFVSASIGVACYPSDSADTDALFRFADSAMYHAKKLGRNNFQFYSGELTARTASRLSLETALRKAADRDELELHYQPQVELGSGRVVGAEALLRWNHDGRPIGPDHFIPIAEETGLIVGIGEWVLDAACRAAVEWNRGRTTPLKIAVNLSTRQFIRNDLPRTLRSIMADTGCLPEWLKLEITESLLLEDSADIAAMLCELNEMGLAVSIDDFGTGYSALGYLHRFPVSQIKIDRSFVRDVPHDRHKSELVKAMISIASSLRLELVAEGVETREQAAYLLQHGCTTAQGYLFGKAMPRTAFARILADGAGSPSHGHGPVAAGA